MKQQADIILVEAASKGDRDSFTELCRRYYPVMVAIAHAITSDRHLGEDAAQQAFAKAAVNMGNLKKKDKFPSWLGSICRNAARDILSRRRTQADMRDVRRVDTDRQADEGVQALRDALAGLGEQAREVVFLRYYDGMSYDRISSVLGISEQAINGRLRRAKKKLAECLRREGFSEVRA